MDATFQSARTPQTGVSDYDLGEGVVPTVIYNDLAQFTYGGASTQRRLPIQKERIALGNLDMSDGHLKASQDD